MKSVAARIAAGLVVCLALASGMSAYAQDTPGAAPAGRGGERSRGGMMGTGVFRTVEKLSGLTDEQKTKLKDVEAKTQEKMKAMRSEAPTTATAAATPDRAAMREKMMAFQKKTMDDINAILTEPQKKELEEKMKEMRQQYQRHGGEGRPQKDGEKKDGEKKEGKKEEKKTE